MSSNPIIINIQDQIDPGIVVKINGIAASSRTAATEVDNLALSLSKLTAAGSILQLNNLGAALGRISVTTQATAPNVLNLSKALGQIGATAPQAVNAGTSLANAINLIGPTAQKSNSQLQNMAHALLLIPQAGANASAATNTLGNRLANLLFRVAGAQLGIGRLGGAIGGLATQLVALAPLLIAIGALVAIAAAVILYEKFRQEANDLADTQASLGKEVGTLNDKLLQQKERISELNGGPLTRYAQALKDIRHETMDVDFSTILKELDEQHSYWNKIDAVVEHLLANVIKYGSLGFIKPANTANAPDTRDIELFIRQLKAAQEQGTLTARMSKEDLKQITEDAKTNGDRMNLDRQGQLAIALKMEKTEIDAENRLLADQTGTNKALTEKNLNALKELYSRDLAAWSEYQNKKTIVSGEQAQAQREEQIKLFNEELNRYKALTPGITAQQERAFRESQLQGIARPTEIPGLDSKAALGGPSGGNIRKVTDQIKELDAEIAQQPFIFDNMIKRYQEAGQKAGAYNDALKAEADAQGIALDAERKRMPLLNDQKKRIADVTLAQQEQIRVGRAMIAVYGDFKAPLETYGATIKATNALELQEVITSKQATIERLKAIETLKQATDPLYEFNQGLEKQTKLLDEYGTALAVDTQILDLQYQLKQQGRSLDKAQEEQLRQTLTDQERQKQVQSDLNDLWEKSIGAQQKNIDQQKALNRALKDGLVSLEQYKLATIGVYLAQNELQNAQGKGGLKSNVVQIFGTLVDTSRTTVQKLDDIWGSFFKTMNKGFADSLAHALVFGTSLKQGLLDTARNAVASLISSLVQLGIELLIIDGLSHIPGIKKLFDLMKAGHQDTKAQAAQLATAIAGIVAITAVQLASISALMGPAWALAEAVSLYTLGANAAPAAAGIAAVVAAGGVVQGVSHFREGGLITGLGGPTADRIPIMASAGEYVVNAAATAANYDLLQAINSGGQAVRANSSAMHVTNNVQMKINVVHDGSTNVAIEQVDETTVRIIAQREAKIAVHEHAPDVIAADLHNPNSRTSKAVQRNIVAPRRR